MTPQFPPAAASPMGRYDTEQAAPDAPLHQIQLRDVPVELFLATRQQHDELQREFAMMALAHQDEAAGDPPELRRLVRELGANSAASASRADEKVEKAAHAGQATVDLIYWVPASVVAAADRLDELMKSADVFCAQGRMLTMPRSPQMRRFAGWWLGELRRQVAGYPPSPWEG